MAEEPITPDTSEETAAAAAAVASESAPLRVKPRADDEEADGQLGAPADPVPDEFIGLIGAPGTGVRKKGLAGLFGGSRGAGAGEALEDAPQWAEPEGGRPRRQGSGIRVVNRLLAAVIVLILLFSVLDLSATIRQSPGDTTISTFTALPDIAAEAAGGDLPAGLPDLAKLLESFTKRPIVRDLESVGQGDTTVQVVTTRKKEPDWKAYVQNLDLIGLSGAADGEQEAIVADRKANRMHFLRIGQDMVAGESQFKLVGIAPDHVVFEKDGEEITVK